MLHLLVASYLLGALLGVAAALFVSRYEALYGFPFLRSFARCLLFSSLLMLVLLSTYYAAANFPQRAAAPAAARFTWSLANNFTGLAAFSGVLASFLQTLRGLEGKPLARWEKRSLALLIGAACCSYALAFFVSASWLQACRDLYNLAVPVLLLAALAELWRRTGGAAFVIPRRAARAFLLLYLGAFSAILALPALSGSALLVLALLLPATHLLPFIWIRGFFLPEMGPAGAVPLEALSARHGLTAREREIVAHLLTGAGNAEIAAALFISTGTVKNHVYNVYRKLGVGSRGQLYRCVRASLEPPPPPRQSP